ncbi:MAG: pyridoxal phosphate-dependent aminotransferase, partial [Candidatus Cloacimonetes bacterium]|nr:pyridoxal phosphate-dependent aminotransferase [Candidatus Cloacimonadota bacterium]
CYANTRGHAELRQLLLRKLARENGMQGLDPHHLQITGGGIHGLYAAFRCLLDPGEEVLTLSPHWHLIGGVIHEAGGLARDLDFYLPLRRGASVRELLEAGLKPTTAALYLNTPNNPSGVVLGRAELEQVAAFAMEHDLWVVSDEAYENFIYDGTPHISIATLPGMHERTVSVFTFSKCLAAAGYRVGYTVCEPWLAERLHAVCSRTVYNAPTNNQMSVLQALEHWDHWFPQLNATYRRLRDRVCSELKVPCLLPASGFYAFMDASAACAGRTAVDVLEELVREGVACVPGAAFGAGFENWFRLCFVSEPEERLALGIERINRVLAR